MRNVVLVALAMTMVAGCGAQYSNLSTPKATSVQAKRGGVQILNVDGLEVKSVESLPVRCPCFELIASNGTTEVRIKFEKSFRGEEVSVDVVEANGRTLTDKADLKKVSRALHLAAEAAGKNKDAVIAVASAL